MQIELGKRYTDKYTYYSGVAVAITQRLHGPTQVALERKDSAGKPEEVWFYPDRLHEATPSSFRMDESGQYV